MSDRSQRRQQDAPVDFELIDTLLDDAINTISTLRKPLDQPTLRAAFRATFAAVEGITYYLKQEALRDPNLYTPDELALLREESYALTPSGEVSVGRRRLPSSYNFVFAARMALRPLLPNITFNPHDPGRLAFERAIQVRHRVTHPRKLRDLHITDAEARSLLEGFRWCHELLNCFEKAVSDLLKAGFEESLEVVERFKAELQKMIMDRKKTDSK